MLNAQPGHRPARAVSELHIRRQFGVTVIAVKRGQGRWQDATGDTVLEAGDEILLTGPIEKAERFHLK